MPDNLSIKKVTFIKVILLCICIYALNNAFVLNTHSVLDEISSKLNSFVNSRQNEILYLHTNGNTFHPGDTLWFKAYNLSSGKYQPTGENAVVHVNLTSENRETEIEQKFQLTKGFSKGQITIPDTLIAGDYFLQAISGNLNQKLNKPFRKKIKINTRNKKELIIKMDLPDKVFSPGENLSSTIEVIGDKSNRIGLMKLKLQLEQDGSIHKKLNIATEKNGIGEFNFKIPVNLGSGALILHAEINHSEFSGSLDINIPVNTLTPNIRFFPEGGQLIAGTENKIAFEAIDAAGSPFNFHGQIVNSENKVFSTIDCPAPGTGYFTLSPQINDSLFLQIVEPEGYEKRYKLPAIQSEGYSIRIQKNSPEYIQLSINANQEAYNDTVHLLLFLRDKVWFSDTKQIKDLQNLNIPVGDMPIGIGQITIFNKTGVPIAERLVFINDSKKLEIHTDSIKDNYQKKEKVSFHFGILNHLGKKVNGRVSISVAPYITQADYGADNIASYFFLKQELTHIPPWAASLFTSNKGNKEILDLILLTRGWRRYTWKNILELPSQKPVRSNLLTGSVSTKKGKPVKNCTVSLMNINTFNALSTTTDSEGKFVFDNNEYLGLLDDSELVLSASSGSKKLLIQLDPAIPVDSASLFDDHTILKTNQAISPVLNPEIKDSAFAKGKSYISDITNKNFWIEDIDVKAKNRVVIPLETFEKKHQSFELGKDQIKTTLGYHQNSGIIQLLHQIAGYFVVERGGKVLFRGYNSLFPDNMQGAVFVINGQLAGYTIHNINHLNSDDIENITVTKSSAAGLKYSPYATGGLVEITTKKGFTYANNTASKKKSPNMITVPGFQFAKEFYSPVYKSNDEKTNSIDLRSTLFWSADVNTHGSKKTLIEYFNSDIPGHYQLRIEGITDEGIPVAFHKNYRVY